MLIYSVVALNGQVKHVPILKPSFLLKYSREQMGFEFPVKVLGLGELFVDETMLDIYIKERVIFILLHPWTGILEFLSFLWCNILSCGGHFREFPISIELLLLLLENLYEALSPWLVCKGPSNESMVWTNPVALDSSVFTFSLLSSLDGFPCTFKHSLFVNYRSLLFLIGGLFGHSLQEHVAYRLEDSLW